MAFKRMLSPEFCEIRPALPHNMHLYVFVRVLQNEEQLRQ